jgi:hypothetical protein
MSLMDWFQDRWRSPGVHLTYEFIDASRVQGLAPPMSAAPMKSGEHYFRITLAEMFLKNSRAWFTNYSPAVYSVVKLTFGSQEEAVSHIAGPSNLQDLKAASLNKGVTINYSLTPLIPFNGGDVEIEAGLVAVPGSNDVKRLLKVLTDFSKTLAVPQLSVALTFAQPLSDGIMDLVGANDNQLVLRLHDTFSQGGGFRPGYLALIGALDKELKVEQMWVKGDRLYYGATSDEAVALTGYDYALLRVDSVDERDDYHALSSIDTPYQSAISALSDAVLEPDPQKKKDKMTEAERLLAAAKVAAFKSSELTFKAGRRQVIQALQKGFDEAKALLAGGAAGQDVAGTLKKAMAGAMSVSEALLAGPPTVADLSANAEV